jgi:hypothetical protein
MPDFSTEPMRLVAQALAGPALTSLSQVRGSKM